MKARMFLGALAALSLAGCATTSPAPRASDVKVADAWRAASKDGAPVTSAADAAVDHAWWRRFGDPVLESLIQEALVRNDSLQIAKSRVAEARAGRSGAQAALLPAVQLTGAVTRGNPGALQGDRVLTQRDASLGASWELDLFGGNRARAREAGALLESQDATRQAVQVALLAEVARNYFDLRNFDRQLALTHRNLDYQRSTLELVNVRHREHVASDLDVQRAAAQVATTEAELPTLQTARDAAANRLNVLLGATPGTHDAAFAVPAALAPLDHRVILAAPASVIAARPDVRAAERAFAASTAARHAATADLFPNVSLTALFGAQTVSPASFNPWGVGANLVAPVLDFGRIQSRIDASRERETQAFLQYRRTVLEAVENMENALAAYVNETARNASLREAFERRADAVRIAEVQYREGQIGFLELVLEQQALLAAESAQVDSELKLRTDLVNVYAAAGGGWRAP